MIFGGVMRPNGRIHRKHNGFTKKSRIMKKNKKRRNETYLDVMFPQCFPSTILMGKQKRDEQPSLNEY